MKRIGDVAAHFKDNFGLAMDWLADAVHEVIPRGTTSIETIPDGEANNVRDMLRTHDLLSVRYLVTSTIEQ